MDIKEYISSGIIESYVLGLASEEEARILTCVRSNNLEVEQAIQEISEMFEQLADTGAMPLPEGMKAQIWTKLQEDSAEFVLPADESLDVSAVTESSIRLVETLPAATDSDKEVNRSITEKSIAPLKATKSYWAIAASALLVASLAANVYSYLEKDEQNLAYANLQKEQQFVAKTAAHLQNKWNMSSNPDFRTVNLKGTDQQLNALAVVFWNTKTAALWLSLENLPTAPAGKQYQLWAIVDGKPVNAGLFPLDMDNEGAYSMLTIPKAEAFAITLEDQGGQVAPTMAALKVIGNT